MSANLEMAQRIRIQDSDSNLQDQFENDNFELFDYWDSKKRKDLSHPGIIATPTFGSYPEDGEHGSTNIDHSNWNPQPQPQTIPQHYDEVWNPNLNMFIRSTTTSQPNLNLQQQFGRIPQDPTLNLDFNLHSSHNQNQNLISNPNFHQVPHHLSTPIYNPPSIHNLSPNLNQRTTSQLPTPKENFNSNQVLNRYQNIVSSSPSSNPLNQYQQQQQQQPITSNPSNSSIQTPKIQIFNNNSSNINSAQSNLQFNTPNKTSNYNFPTQLQQQQHQPPSLPSNQKIFHYSESNFDIIKILSHIHFRKNPKYQLGPIDFSCPLVVTSPLEYDNPIIYVSPSFEQLTSYSQSEVLGNNCRFLQSPLGDVHKVIRGKTEPSTIEVLKNSIQSFEECQVQILNYTKTRKPFLNLLTIVPISFENDLIESGMEYYFVGFLCDLSSFSISKPIVSQRNQEIKKFQDLPQREPRITIQSETLEQPQPQSQSQSQSPLPSPSPSPSPSPYHHHEKNIKSEKDGQIKVSNKKVEGISGIDWNSRSENEFISQLTIDGIYLYISSASTKILGFPEDKIIGKSIYEFLHPNDIEKFSTLHQVMKKGQEGQPLKLSHQFRTKYGNYLFVDTTFTIFLNPISQTPQLIICQTKLNQLNESFESIQSKIDRNHTDATTLTFKKNTTPLLTSTSTSTTPSTLSCSTCFTTSSPEWRKGPQGSKTLCNACGLRYSKMKRKLRERGINSDALIESQAQKALGFEESKRKKSRLKRAPFEHETLHLEGKQLENIQESQVQVQQQPQQQSQQQQQNLSSTPNLMQDQGGNE